MNGGDGRIGSGVDDGWSDEWWRWEGGCGMVEGVANGGDGRRGSGVNGGWSDEGWINEWWRWEDRLWSR